MTVRRGIVALLAVAWLAAGLAGAYVYVQRYVDYRGFATPSTPAGVARGTLHEVRFYSSAVGRPSRYLVYLPPGYAAQAAQGRRFPVLYLLHGSPGRDTVFTDVAAAHVAANELIARHRMPPTILVMPAGLQGLTADTEWANTHAGRWEDFVGDVVRDVDHRFATRADRRDRGIAGDSEGAYGAVNIALHHLDEFSVVESWSGYFTQTQASVFSGASAAELRANSPAAYVETLAPEIHRLGLRAWMYEGRKDAAETADPSLLRSFAAELHRAGADVHVGFFPGGHDWGLWRAQTPHMLAVAGRWFTQPLPARAGFIAVGRSLTPSALHRLRAQRHRRCLALRPGPGVHISRGCRRYRALAGQLAR
jgi:enterochelin esterase-like enzyme